jgi:hypothetical protein
VKDDHILIYSLKERDSELRTKKIPRVSNQIVGQGFHHYIVKNIDKIASGAILHIRMVLPAQLDDYAFRIRKKKIDGDLDCSPAKVTPLFSISMRTGKI